jgi:hypothetical protein
MIKDRALNNIQVPPKVAGPFVVQQKEFKKLEVKIDVKKIYNKNFERYFVNDIPRLFPWLVPPPKPQTPIKQVHSKHDMSSDSNLTKLESALAGTKNEKFSTAIDGSSMGESTVMSEIQP